MLRHAAAVVCLVAAGAASAAACGGDSESDRARQAAESYVHDLGARDGAKVCADMTRALQRTFVSTVTRANPEVHGLICGEIMDRALSSVPADQLDAFTTAKIEDVQLNGAMGAFAYRLHDIKVPGKVAREGEAWKVSCCVPGQQS
jgi:hypothetical protein